MRERAVKFGFLLASLVEIIIFRIKGKEMKEEKPILSGKLRADDLVKLMQTNVGFRRRK